MPHVSNSEPPEVRLLRAMCRLENLPTEADGSYRWYWTLSVTPLDYECHLWYAGGESYRPRLEDPSIVGHGATLAEAIEDACRILIPS